MTMNSNSDISILESAPANKLATKSRLYNMMYGKVLGTYKDLPEDMRRYPVSITGIMALARKILSDPCDITFMEGMIFEEFYSPFHNDLLKEGLPGILDELGHKYDPDTSFIADTILTQEFKSISMTYLESEYSDIIYQLRGLYNSKVRGTDDITRLINLIDGFITDDKCSYSTLVIRSLNVNKIVNDLENYSEECYHAIRTYLSELYWRMNNKVLEYTSMISVEGLCNHASPKVYLMMILISLGKVRLYFDMFKTFHELEYLTDNVIEKMSTELIDVDNIN